jgi:hypothetical protein
MKQYRIEITDLAEEDLENAGNYISYVGWRRLLPAYFIVFF